MAWKGEEKLDLDICRVAAEFLVTPLAACKPMLACPDCVDPDMQLLTRRLGRVTAPDAAGS